MIILGVDPGSRFTGYGLVEVERGCERVIEFGVLRLDGEESHALRLKHIYDRLMAVVQRCPPDECAVEMPVYGKNPQSMLKLGRAQAAAMLVVLNRQIPVTQYSPKEVKKSVTGNGNASKEQVWYMVRSLLEITDLDGPLATDASDALAVSLCHAHRLNGKTEKTRYRDWSGFLRENPERAR